ncbi:AAA family ATPase [Thalassospira sp. GO-4]|jgi:predicted ATP-dependent endonuclease of OLD family|uniref:ATP-dependent nuclease n=1 Tax=Thalassospira sp. GO-4 TaxID=2946605 RepID=UPI0020259D98|nr:AAA family ATPase [Thalassospira sp. GO-4]URK16952.1 AAA family ATPase [Thalassospira sp. GO-4]
MHIERIVIQNYRAIRNLDMQLQDGFNLIVGDNETGKSSLLEAINLCLRGQLNRRPIRYELHPFLFNVDTVADYLEQLRAGNNPRPPEILIETYFTGCPPDLQHLEGIANSKGTNSAGLRLRISLDEENFAAEYRDFIREPDKLTSIPVELYKVERWTFSDKQVNQNLPPVRCALIDPSEISNTHHANKYLLELVEDQLSDQQRVSLSLSYRELKDKFLAQDEVLEVNEQLERNRRHLLGNKSLTVGLDTTSKASWENTVQPHIEGIPISLIGKGEQSNIKIRLAVEAANATGVILIEEPENHLSHTRLHTLLSQLRERANGRQFIISTHSSFVLNKLGVDNTIMFNRANHSSLENLSPSTENYFRKLPGQDTLRIILATKTILVEGPSDELIIQKAYFQVHDALPADRGVEIISVRSLAFKRFMEIAQLMESETHVITDNDGDPARVAALYADFMKSPNIHVHFPPEAHLNTLEPQICAINTLEVLNRALGKEFQDKDAARDWMLKNKTEAALRIFDSDETIEIPEYILNAVR